MKRLIKQTFIMLVALFFVAAAHADLVMQQINNSTDTTITVKGDKCR